MRDTFATNPYPSKGELVVTFGGYAQTEPSHKAGPSVHDHMLVHLVLNGKGKYHCMGREYKLAQGDSFFIFPGDLVHYEADADEPWEYCWIGFRGHAADEMLSKMYITAQRPVVSGRSLRKLRLLNNRILQSLQRGDSNCDLIAGGYMRLLLAEYAGKKANNPTEGETPSTMIQQQVEQAIRWITLQYYQPISIENMAQSLGYHRTHLSKMFKQHTGFSPMNYLLKVRMERAKLLLQNERLTVDQVASSVGFPDSLYFSKQFKKWFGSSPTDYRNITRKRDPSPCQ
ncbi:AraC family transcriptional regulator [Paenibacillus swuensis]|uniref:AraC family transcriptional regulator n=1 Tax=Paenibacillus swuensis TaxID=1178515 RepID=A0A172TPT2_9BACL|nr:AraC family transcriptional regulator [Paenibacillus swuensis]